jgi:hypothetical protein
MPGGQDQGFFSALLSRFGGSAPSTSATPPEIAEAIKIAKQERPDLGSVETYGTLSKMLQPRAEGYVSPGRTIYLNPDQLKGKDPQYIADTLIHEQTHVDQMKRRNKSSFGELMRLMMGGPAEAYGQRPDEMEAFQAEKDYRAKQGRPLGTVPSFENPGEYRNPGDISLPADKKKQ